MTQKSPPVTINLDHEQGRTSARPPTPHHSPPRKPATAAEVLQRCELIFKPDSTIKDKGAEVASVDAVGQMLQSLTLLNAARRSQMAQYENTATLLSEKNNRLKEVQGDFKKLEDKYKKLKSEVDELRAFKKQAIVDLEGKKTMEETNATLTANFKALAAEQYYTGFKCCLAQVLHLQPDFDTSRMGVCKSVVDDQLEGSDDEDDVRLLLQPPSPDAEEDLEDKRDNVDEEDMPEDGVGGDGDGEQRNE